MISESRHESTKLREKQTVSTVLSENWIVKLPHLSIRYTKTEPKLNKIDQEFVCKLCVSYQVAVWLQNYFDTIKADHDTENR